MSAFENKFDISASPKWYHHLFFWIAIIIIFITRATYEDTSHTFKTSFTYVLCHLTPIIPLSYLIAYIIIPKFYQKKKYWLTAILLLFIYYIASALGRIMIVHVGEPIVRIPPYYTESIQEILTDLPKLIFHYFPQIFTISLIFTFIKTFIEYNRVTQKSILLDKEKATAELSLLKAQLNPHFLFNTLNNIYMLSLDNSPKTPESIGKLSEILDHILYKCNRKYVSLSSEISLLENYIALEKLRYDDRLKVNFSKDIGYDIEIAPLILLSLVENAFKHGAGEDSGSPEITIDIVLKDNLFTFNIMNTIATTYESNHKGYLGLTNIRKQLDLIYSNSYNLNIIPQTNTFAVNLQITL
ncbi:sensor histidine kinase [Aquimarina rhabdastrellae]